MFCLGERDTLLVTYISGSCFFKDTLLCREKSPAREGGLPEGSGSGNSSRLKIVSGRRAAREGAFCASLPPSLCVFSGFVLTLVVWGLHTPDQSQVWGQSEAHGKGRVRSRPPDFSGCRLPAAACGHAVMVSAPMGSASLGPLALWPQLGGLLGPRLWGCL